MLQDFWDLNFNILFVWIVVGVAVYQSIVGVARANSYGNGKIKNQWCRILHISDIQYISGII